MPSKTLDTVVITTLQCMVVTAMRTKGSSRLSTSKRKQLMLDLCRSLAVLKSPREVAEALTDLLTSREMETIAKRLQIAELLVGGKDYWFIRDELRVGYSTISRVNTWLNLSGEGFKVMIERRPKSEKSKELGELYDPYSWNNIKRRNSLYFWPQLLLEELLKNSNKHEKEKIRSILDKLDVKKEKFTSEANKAVYESFSSSLPKSPRE